MSVRLCALRTRNQDVFFSFVFHKSDRTVQNVSLSPNCSMYQFGGNFFLYLFIGRILSVDSIEVGRVFMRGLCVKKNICRYIYIRIFMTINQADSVLSFKYSIACYGIFMYSSIYILHSLNVIYVLDSRSQWVHVNGDCRSANRMYSLITKRLSIDIMNERNFRTKAMKR